MFQALITILLVIMVMMTIIMTMHMNMSHPYVECACPCEDKFVKTIPNTRIENEIRTIRFKGSPRKIQAQRFPRMEQC